MIYQEGQIVEDYKEHQDSIFLDVQQEGISILTIFKEPKEVEINQFDEDKVFEIRFTSLQNVMLFVVKIGGLTWMDLPYNPHLSEPAAELPAPAEQGYKLYLQLLDSATGEIKKLRIIQLSLTFSQKLYHMLAEIRQQPFDEEQFKAATENIYRTYQTKEIKKMTNNYFRC